MKATEKRLSVDGHSKDKKTYCYETRKYKHKRHCEKCGERTIVHDAIRIGISFDLNTFEQIVLASRALGIRVNEYINLVMRDASRNSLEQFTLQDQTRKEKGIPDDYIEQIRRLFSTEHIVWARHLKK